MSSPRTPRHSRHSSAVDAHPESPQARRQSNDPTISYRNSFNQQDSLDLNELSTAGAGANSMGNLADELADAFSESGDEEEPDDNDEEIEGTGATEQAGAGSGDNGDHSTTDVSRPGDGSLSLPSPRRKNHRKKESTYDGSEYGSESDLDSSGMSPSLVAKIDAIDSLARRGTENYGGPTDDVIQRVTNSLRDLGSQSSVEGSASRWELPNQLRRWS